MGTAIKHPVQNWVKSSFVIFDIRAHWRSGLCVRVPGCQIYKWRLNPVWHRMLYGCTHMTTVGVKGLSICPSSRGRAGYGYELRGYGYGATGTVPIPAHTRTRSSVRYGAMGTGMSG